MSIEQASLEELRRDILEEDRRDMLEEIKMRNDDDYFYSYVTDRYVKEAQAFAWLCNQYDRNPSEWFQLLLQK